MSQRHIKYRKRIDKVTVKADGSTEIDALLEQLQRSYLQNVKRGMDAKVGPHMAEVARQRAPVGKSRDFNPRTSSFEALKLKPLGSLPVTADYETRGRHAALAGLVGAERVRAINPRTDAQFFMGAGDRKNKNRNKGVTPTIIEVQRGTIRGAFAHVPGTLRKSINYEGSRIEGNRVIGVVRARAPYAMARHQGFTQWAGTPPGQKPGRKIPGKPFLRQAFANIKEELKNPATYKG